MKKLLLLTLAGIIIISAFSGCSKKDKEGETSTSKSETSSLNEETTKSDMDYLFSKEYDSAEDADIKILLPWSEVKEDYEKIDLVVNDETSKKEKYTEDDIDLYVDTIEKDFDEIKSGVTTDNYDSAKELYEMGVRLKTATEKAKVKSENVLVKIADFATEYAKHLHGNTNDTKLKFSEAQNGLMKYLGIAPLTEDEAKGKSSDEIEKMNDKAIEELESAKEELLKAFE